MLTGPQSINSPQFMEPEDSLWHSQVTTTCPYPQTEKTSPCCPIPLLEDPIQYYPPLIISFTVKHITNIHIMVRVKQIVKKWSRCRQVFGNFKMKHCQLRTLITKPASSIVVRVEYEAASFPTHYCNNICTP